MKVKTYKNRSLQEGLDDIKRDLGSDALILSTRSVSERPRFSLFKKEAWEITAALDEKDEKPRVAPGVSHLVFAGVGMFEQSIFDSFPKKLPKEISLEHDIFPRLIEASSLHGYPFEGQWFDVSTPEIYERVLKEWQERDILRT